MGFQMEYINQYHGYTLNLEAKYNIVINFEAKVRFKWVMQCSNAQFNPRWWRLTGAQLREDPLGVLGVRTPAFFFQKHKSALFLGVVWNYLLYFAEYN